MVRAVTASSCIIPTHLPTCMHACMHARMRARTHTQTHTRTHTRTHHRCGHHWLPSLSCSVATRLRSEGGAWHVCDAHRMRKCGCVIYTMRSAQHLRARGEGGQGASEFAGVHRGAPGKRARVMDGGDGLELVRLPAFMDACMHACIPIHIHACMQACLPVCLPACLLADLHSCRHPSLRPAMHACMYTCVRARLRTYTYRSGRC